MKRIFREIHLWLSVPFGLIITLICFSGATMVYEKEITEWCQSDLYHVKEVKAEAIPLDSLMQIAAASLPEDVTITGVTVSDDAQRPYQVSLSKPRRASMFIDQYTGEIKGQYSRLPFFDTMFHLHRWLLGEAQSASGGMSAGKWLVGTSTLVLVFILLTGILMWLTNRHKPLAKSLTISVSHGWGRFWHDLHVAGGIYATIFLLAIALTGLTWSFNWYRTGFYAMCGVEASAEGYHGGGASHGGNADASTHSHNHDDATHNAHGNRGGEDAEQGRSHRYGAEAVSETAEGRGQSQEERHQRSPYIHWQKVLDRVAAENPGYRQITVNAEAAEVVPEGRMSLRATDKYKYDRSGEITGVRPYSTQDNSAKVRSAIYTIHVGSWGGHITRFITFLAALLGATLPLTGYYLWIRRLTNKHKNKHHEHKNG